MLKPKIFPFLLVLTLHNRFNGWCKTLNYQIIKRTATFNIALLTAEFYEIKKRKKKFTFWAFSKAWIIKSAVQKEDLNYLQF